MLNHEPQHGVWGILREIEAKSAASDYLYRCEPEHYGKISSNLYRQYAAIEAEEFDIEVVQEEILAEAVTYSHETEEPFEILTLLQHHGGKTNLIDFTTDFLVALFFACDSSASHGKAGRVILLKRNEALKDWIYRPRHPWNRVIAQKSLFVRHPRGFFLPEDVTIVTIPAALKLPILAYLRKYHGISTETIYNDLHGFIRHQSIHESAYTAFHRGLTYQLKGDDAVDASAQQAAYEQAVVHYTQALEMKPDLPEACNNRGTVYRAIGEIDKAIADYTRAIECAPEDSTAYNNRGTAYRSKGEIDAAIADYSYAIECEPADADAYNNRGNVYRDKGEVNSAIQDYTEAVELNPEYAEAYCNRGIAWLHMQVWENARADLTAAMDMGVDIIADFHNTAESVAAFEQHLGVQLPEDIAELLQRQ